LKTKNEKPRNIVKTLDKANAGAIKSETVRKLTKLCPTLLYIEN